MVAKGVFILSVYIKLHHATKWDYSLIKKQKQASWIQNVPGRDECE